MIDIFTVLVTFLLMTAVFSRTVILQMNLPAPQAEFKEPPPGLQLEVMVRKDLLQVADRNTGPLHTVPNTAKGYDYDGLDEYLKFVKTKFPEKTEATILLEPDTAYDTLVQVMDHVRVFEVRAGNKHGAGGVVPGYLDRRCTGDRHPAARCGSTGRGTGGCAACAGARAGEADHEHIESRPAHGAASPAQPRRRAAQSHPAHRHPVGDGGIPAGVLDRGGDHPEQQGHRDPAVHRADRAEALGGGDDHARTDLFVQGELITTVAEIQRRAGRARRAAARRSQAPAAGRSGR